MELIFATHNAHKAEEVQHILAGTGITVKTLADLGFAEDPPETGHTFEHNAMQKARFVQARTGGWVVADDSGLEVDALDGAPGVHSKRFSPEATGEANNTLLLERLGPESNRSARFRCVIAVVGPDGEERTADGRCEGSITTGPTGLEGFGYDPLFVPDGDSRTMAELTMDEKNTISHRGRAFRKLPELLP